MKTIQSQRLVFSEGSSDKEYNLQLIQDGTDYLVNFQFGRRNSTLKSGTKTDSPVTLDAAEKIYQKLLKEKTGKGYMPDGASGSTYIPVSKEESGIIPQLLNDITEEELNDYINDENYVFQKKHDGERRLVLKSETDCFGGNRKGQKVSLPNEVIESAENTVVDVDGEIIGITVYVFDLLSLNGKSLKDKPYGKRLEQLEKCKFGPHIVVVQTAKSSKEKRALLEKLREDSAEGVVIKDLNKAYTSSRPNSGGPALKYKFYKTATVKVLKHTKGKRSVGVGVFSGGEFVAVGSVTIPPNKEIPAVGQLVEVRYLYAYKGGSLYQPTYLQERTDLDDEDASIDQLEYKQE
jgi:bifunctional non-homologous end joining protein LigD